MKTRNWIKFKRTVPRQDRGQMRFTLNADMILSVNFAGFVALQKPAAVEIYFDEAEELIGLVPVNIDAPDAYPVRSRIKSGGKCITLKHFCTRFGLKPGRTIFFRSPAFDPDGTLVLNYRQALESGCGVTEPQSQEFADPMSVRQSSVAGIG